MKAYIFCPSGFALRADGVFLGNFYGEACIDTPPCLIELLPHSAKPTCFYLNGQLKNGNGIFAHTLIDGVFIEARPNKYESGEMTVLYQTRPTADTLVTAYKTDRTRIVVENAYSAESVTIPFDVENFSYELVDKTLYVCAEGKRKFLCVFLLGNKLLLLFAKMVEEYSVNPVFHTKTRLFDLERTTVECNWVGSPLSPINESVHRGRRLDADSPAFIRRAFFERALYRQAPEELLCEALKPHAEKLYSYLGNFIGVLPDFCTKKGTYLTYRGKDKHPCRLFDVKIENGFITNIEELDE